LEYKPTANAWEIFVPSLLCSEDEDVKNAVLRGVDDASQTPVHLPLYRNPSSTSLSTGSAGAWIVITDVVAPTDKCLTIEEEVKYCFERVIGMSCFNMIEA
jgi:hypothetical protein